MERISIGDIPEQITDNYNGDFNEIKNNLNTCIVTMNELVAEENMVSFGGQRKANSTIEHEASRPADDLAKTPGERYYYEYCRSFERDC